MSRGRLFVTQSGLGREQDHQHLGDLGAGVADGLLAAADAVEGVAGFQNGLAVLGIEGHLSGEDVVDGLHGVGGKLGAAAGHKIGDAHDDLRAFDIVGAAALLVEQTGGDALVVAGRLVSVNGAALSAAGSLNSVVGHVILLLYIHSSESGPPKGAWIVYIVRQSPRLVNACGEKRNRIVTVQR